MAAARLSPLLGRASERQQLDRLLDGARAGRSAVLVVRGEAGIGKTALLHYCTRQASGFRVVRTAGVESEMELPFAGLHQLCTPLVNRLDSLPPPQRAALGVALGLSSGPSPERFLVALAALSLLSEVAAERPLLCVVDDVQWLDAASAQVLGFVARRLRAEPVAIVFGVRDASDERELAGLPELRLEGLEIEHGRALLATVIPGRLDERVRDRLIAEARGNPLALLELPRGLAAAQLPGAVGPPGAQALDGQIERRFLQQLETYPEPARRLLLLAAAEPVGDSVLLYRAADRLGIDPSASVDETEGLLTIGERVTFRHPLVRSAVYRSASPQSRRAVHLALAEAGDRELDADRRAWHLAAAAPGRDEAVASELEHSAARAQARGGLTAAAAFLTRAAELTPDPARRAERALAAAFASVNAGAFDAARTLIGMLGAGPLHDLQRAQIDLLRAHLAFASSRGTEATPLLLAAARRLEPFDLRLARETYLDAFSAALFGARLNETVGVPEIAEAARAAPRPEAASPTSADLLLDGLVALTDGYAQGVPPCRRALERLTAGDLSPEERLRWLWQGCVVALELWDEERASLLSGRGVEIARKTGTLSELALALSARTPVLVLCGDLTGAAETVAETRSVHEATGISAAPYGALILAAWQGQAGVASELIDRTIRDASARGEGIGLAIAHYTRAVLCNGSGRFREALEGARGASEHREVVAENWGLSELIEPAVRTGRIDLATEALDRLAEKARATGTAWALGVEARSRALVSEDDEAERLYRESIERLAGTRLRPDLARAHLLYGEWLRREGRRSDAREHLRTAHGLCTAIGLEGFAERASRELIATGERVRKRVAEARDELTAQEGQVASMARDGLTNGEIGARLFLSPRTIEWHLHNVFAKLGIDSRRELASALPARDAAASCA